eukprot:scaffold5832_cov109-Isochrysis_galbana.AAC.2
MSGAAVKPPRFPPREQRPPAPISASPRLASAASVPRAAAAAGGRRRPLQEASCSPIRTASPALPHPFLRSSSHSLPRTPPLPLSPVFPFLRSSSHSLPRSPSPLFPVFFAQPPPLSPTPFFGLHLRRRHRQHSDDHPVWARELRIESQTASVGVRDGLEHLVSALGGQLQLALVLVRRLLRGQGDR